MKSPPEDVRHRTLACASSSRMPRADHLVVVVADFDVLERCVVVVVANFVVALVDQSVKVVDETVVDSLVVGALAVEERSGVEDDLVVVDTTDVVAAVVIRVLVVAVKLLWLRCSAARWHLSPETTPC
mmetsp:Transcript_47460/g.109867  ORF Transcript_47460/g.109867 Transcript_47460/m.109867 type:complete len:128 (-) Transcript_47460:523-906(-)